MELESVIAGQLDNLLEESGISLDEPLTGDTVLLATGLDSLAFAVLVVRLEAELGYDPFVLMEQPVYPRTYGEFVGVYERYKGHRR
jgi:hypothetical protein